MFRILLFFLLLGDFVISSGIDITGDVYYCIKEKESDTCLCPDPVDEIHCHDLQYFINNVNTTINNHSKANVTYFMNGTHNVSFIERVGITAPAQLNVIGPSATARIRAYCNCNNSDVDCGLLFENRSRDIVIQIENLEVFNISIKLNNDANVTYTTTSEVDDAVGRAILQVGPYVDVLHSLASYDLRESS